MNIILQNYKNLIINLINKHFIDNLDNVLNNFDSFSIDNYLSLISNFDFNMNSFICNSLIELINHIDYQFCNSKERKCKYHIKDYKKRTILTVFGEITYYRHFYKSKLNGASFCYIDRLLGLKKYDYFDPYIKSEVLDFVSENNYSETAKHINSLIGNRVNINDKIQFMKRQTVRNIIMNSHLSKPKFEKKDDVSELFIMADEKWIPTQNNNGKKVMQKSIVIFDGFNKHGDRKSLNNKTTFSGSGDNFIYDSIDYIENSYESIKRIYLLGDGAKWIDNLKFYFNYNPHIEIIQGLDHFHFKQAIWRILPDKDVYNALVEYIKSNNIEDYKRLINEIIDLYSNREDKIKEYSSYIIKHWNNILNLYTYNLSCPMESQISHTFASYFTSRPKGYSVKTIPKLIKLRLLKKNKYNIKELYLNNLNSKEELDLNNKTLNFSIVENNTSFIVMNNKLNNKLAI